MIYVKSFLFGLGGAVLAAVVWFAVKFMVPLYVPYLTRHIRFNGGVSDAYITSDSILLAAVIGFVLAFAWRWRRLRVA